MDIFRNNTLNSSNDALCPKDFDVNDQKEAKTN